jgi:L-ascorbate metabolism protein UlaG (beta-lactamase superfamily)
VRVRNDKLYLRQNIQVEPLIDRWYAWCHVIAPATAARNITERHMRIMESFCKSPQQHAAAIQNPKMRGGPFIDYDESRVGEIQQLLCRTKQDRAKLIELSAAIVALDAMLRSKAVGTTLEPLYKDVPEPLRGYVELTYNRNHQPAFRLFESLLYSSPYYDRSAQTIMLQPILSDDRPFHLSTPRLDSDETVHLRLPFDHASVDELFRLKSTPRPWSEIRDRLEIEDDQAGRMRSYLTEEAPPQHKAYDGPGVRWRYFGHACILVESGGKSILVDPILSYTYETTISRYTYADLPDAIDYVLITHGHQDHISFETMLQIRHKVRHVLVPRNGSGNLEDPSLKLLLNHCGFDNVIEFSEMDELKAGNLCITGLPFLGEHADLDVHAKMAWLVRFGAHSLLFAADCCNIEPRVFEHVRRAIGDVEVLFLGMECDGAPLAWLYGPLLTQTLDRTINASRRLAGSDCEQGMQMIDALECKEAYVYAMGQEPWLNYIMSLKYTEESKPIVESNRLIKECAARGIVAERLFGEKEILVA